MVPREEKAVQGATSCGHAAATSPRGGWRVGGFGMAVPKALMVGAKAAEIEWVDFYRG
jgi:hypothetical protein